MKLTSKAAVREGKLAHGRGSTSRAPFQPEIPPATAHAMSMNEQPPSPPERLNRPVGFARVARRLAVIAAAGLTLSMVVQLLTAGAAVFVNPEWWVLHGDAIHWFDWLSPVTMALAFLGRMSRRFKIQTATVLGLVFVQYVTAGLRESPTLGAGAALHPLTGFLLFWVITELLRRAWIEARP